MNTNTFVSNSQLFGKYESCFCHRFDHKEYGNEAFVDMLDLTKENPANVAEGEAVLEAIHGLPLTYARMTSNLSRNLVEKSPTMPPVMALFGSHTWVIRESTGALKAYSFERSFVLSEIVLCMQTNSDEFVPEGLKVSRAEVEALINTTSDLINWKEAEEVCSVAIAECPTYQFTNKDGTDYTRDMCSWEHTITNVTRDSVTIVFVHTQTGHELFATYQRPLTTHSALRRHLVVWHLEPTSPRTNIVSAVSGIAAWQKVKQHFASEFGLDSNDDSLHLDSAILLSDVETIPVTD